MGGSVVFVFKCGRDFAVVLKEKRLLFFDVLGEHINQRFLVDGALLWFLLGRLFLRTIYSGRFPTFLVCRFLLSATFASCLALILAIAIFLLPSFSLTRVFLRRALIRLCILSLDIAALRPSCSLAFAGLLWLLSFLRLLLGRRVSLLLRLLDLVSPGYALKRVLIRVRFRVRRALTDVVEFLLLGLLLGGVMRAASRCISSS